MQLYYCLQVSGGSAEPQSKGKKAWSLRERISTAYKGNERLTGTQESRVRLTNLTITTGKIVMEGINGSSASLRI
jgi:hypothetical protein